jgi:hypothetical protein
LISGAIAAVREPPSASQGVTEKSTALPCRENSAYLRRLERADERTRTADPTSLRVIIHALHGFAQGCKFPILKPVSVLCISLCCTVLRSRWCQSGVRSPCFTRRRFLCKLDPRIGCSGSLDARVGMRTGCPQPDKFTLGCIRHRHHSGNVHIQRRSWPLQASSSGSRLCAHTIV